MTLLLSTSLVAERDVGQVVVVLHSAQAPDARARGRVAEGLLERKMGEILMARVL